MRIVGLFYLMVVFAPRVQALPESHAIYKFATKDLAAQNILVVRFSTTYANFTKVYWLNLQRVDAYLKESQQSPGGPAIARFLKMDPQNAVVEAGYPVTRPIEGNGVVYINQIPAAHVVFTTHIGAHDDLGQAHVAFQKWYKDNKKTLIGAPWDVFVRDPKTTPKEKLETQIYYPFR